MMLLTSLQNPKVKDLISLRDRRDREEKQQFIIEGYREILRATDAKWKITTLFICPELFLGSNEQFLIDRIFKSGTEVIKCDEKVFKKISYRDRPDGLVA